MRNGCGWDRLKDRGLAAWGKKGKEGTGNDRGEEDTLDCRGARKSLKTRARGNKLPLCPFCLFPDEAAWVTGLCDECGKEGQDLWGKSGGEKMGRFWEKTPRSQATRFWPPCVSRFLSPVFQFFRRLVLPALTLCYPSALCVPCFPLPSAVRVCGGPTSPEFHRKHTINLARRNFSGGRHAAHVLARAAAICSDDGLVRAESIVCGASRCNR